MTTILGWVIIIGLLAAGSLALCWPAYRLMRRARPDSAGLVWAYVATSAALSLVIWYALPLAVHGVLGRVAH
jgi:hypothetical protein